MGQPSQRNIRRRSSETFRAGQLDCRHAQPLDVARMTDRPHRNAIVNLENFLTGPTEREKQNAVPITERRYGTARSQLRLNVLPTIGDRFDPTIRLLDHATVF